MTDETNAAPVRATARRRFLNVLAETGSVRAAAAASGRTRTAWISLRARDPAFAALWEQAQDAYVELLEAEADRRAVRGEEEPVFSYGKQVGMRSRTSDSLLMFRLKALRPRRYRGAEEESAAAEPLTVEVKSFGGNQE
jgi:hypothetical protein